MTKPVYTLSGGQKTRVCFRQTSALPTPDLIILDEPTNHLDMNPRLPGWKPILLNYNGRGFNRCPRPVFSRTGSPRRSSRSTTGEGDHLSWAIIPTTPRKKHSCVRHRDERLVKPAGRKSSIRKRSSQKLKSFNREKVDQACRKPRKKCLPKSRCWISPAEVRSEMHIQPGAQASISGNDVLTVEASGKILWTATRLFSDLAFRR